jgi:hypothetical protein
MEKFDFNDILIQPTKLSSISSRKSINPFHNGFLPLITAPMDTVIDNSTIQQYTDLKIIPCLPRGEQWVDGNKFSSFSLIEIENMCKTPGRVEYSKKSGYFLIDIANGHMEKMVTTVKKFKKLFPRSKLMVGNIANPETYVELSNAGADYIRVGIGNGGGCSTTVHTGVGYPMASLVQECYLLSCQLDKPAKIVADGGMQNYSDIIKALAFNKV